VIEQHQNIFLKIQNTKHKKQHIKQTLTIIKIENLINFFQNKIKKELKFSKKNHKTPKNVKRNI
jgi:hypothetical protein